MSKYFYNISEGMAHTAYRIAAKFSDAAQAKSAHQKIVSMLDSAKEEVHKLLENQNGIADVADVTEIYSRFGLRNDIGWEQEHPIRIDHDEIIWDTPVGVHLDEIQTRLLAFDAEAVIAHDLGDSEHWRDAPHPMTIALPEGDFELLSGFDEDDNEHIRFVPPVKKVLH